METVKNIVIVAGGLFLGIMMFWVAMTFIIALLQLFLKLGGLVV